MSGWPTTDPLEYLDELPDPRAPWHPSIVEFALRFEGYDSRRGREPLPDFGNDVYANWVSRSELPLTLRALGPVEGIRALRELLYFEQRVQWHAEDSSGSAASEPPPNRFAYARALLSELRVKRDVFWALPVQARARQALAARLKWLGVDGLDGDTRTESVADALVPTVTGADLDFALNDVRGGSGGELECTPPKRPKFHSAYSSCAFAVNMFGPWRESPAGLSLNEYGGFESLAFEVMCRIFPRGTPRTWTC
jgi:hypothetical protein